MSKTTIEIKLHGDRTVSLTIKGRAMQTLHEVLSFETDWAANEAMSRALTWARAFASADGDLERTMKELRRAEALRKQLSESTSPSKPAGRTTRLRHAIKSAVERGQA